MTPKVHRLWNGCKANMQFRDDIQKADPKDIIGLITDESEMIICASFYYGWLVAKYGKEWEQHL